MNEKEESNRLLGDTNDLVRKYRYHNGWRLVLLASLLLNIVLSCVVVTFVVCQYSTPASSYEKGFQTDLGKSFEIFMMHHWPYQLPVNRISKFCMHVLLLTHFDNCSSTRTHQT